MASTSGRSSNSHLFFFAATPPSQAQPTQPLATPSGLPFRRQRPRARRPNGLAIVQAGQLPPASVRGGGGRRQAEASTIAIQPSSLTAPSTSPSSSSFSLVTVAAGALLALAAAWAAISFVRERGAVSSSASAAGLRGGSASGTRRRGRKRNASGDDKTSSWPPPRSYRAALSVTRRSVALTRAVQAVDFGNIAAALTELDRALAEHAAAGGSGEERREGREGSDGSEAGGRWTSPLPSGTGEEDVRICTFSCCSFVSFPSALLEVARSETENGTQKKKTSKRKKKKNSKKTDAPSLRPPPAELGGLVLSPRGAEAAAVAPASE